MKPLTTKNINKVLKNNAVTGRYFLGAYPACIVPSSSKQPYSFITNTKFHDEAGEHWNAWFVDKNKLTFFDSFGRDPRDNSFPEFYKDILKTFSRVSFTQYRVQDIDSVSCGYFCVHFIYTLSLKLDFNFFLEDYSDDLKMNDIIALRFYNSLK